LVYGCRVGRAKCGREERLGKNGTPHLPSERGGRKKKEGEYPEEQHEFLVMKLMSPLAFIYGKGLFASRELTEDWGAPSGRKGLKRDSYKQKEKIGTTAAKRSGEKKVKQCPPKSKVIVEVG